MAFEIEVSGCSDCPMSVVWDDNRGWLLVCDHPKSRIRAAPNVVQDRRVDRRSMIPAPNWCPLRIEQVLVTLRIKPQ